MNQVLIDTSVWRRHFSGKLAQRGIGWVDAQLVACALTHSALLWAIDKNLETVADELKVWFQGFE